MITSNAPTPHGQKMKLITSRDKPPSGRVDLCTPDWILELALGCIGAREFDLDAASNPNSIVPARTHLVDPDRDWGGLPEGFHPVSGLHSWAGFSSVWVNPPYRRDLNPTWAKHVAKQAKLGIPIIGLVPVAISEVWWEPYWRAEHLAFLSTRVRHVGEPHSATFPQAIVGWNLPRFAEAWKCIARVRN